VANTNADSLVVFVFLNRFKTYYISAISWRPVLVVEEAGVPGENHAPTMGKQLVNFIACGCESNVYKIQSYAVVLQIP
jgi:hypothetical protein